MAVSRRDRLGDHDEIEDRLAGWTRRLNDHRQELARLEGEKRSLLARLRDLGCKDLEAARNLVKKIDADVKKKREKLDALITDLERFDWDN